MKNLTEAEKSAYLVIYEDRVKRLEKQIKELKEENVKLKAVTPSFDYKWDFGKVCKLEEKNEKLVEALKFYADKDNWLVRDCDADTIYYDDCDDSIAGHGGKRARKVLKEVLGERSNSIQDKS